MHDKKTWTRLIWRATKWITLFFFCFVQLLTFLVCVYRFVELNYIVVSESRPDKILTKRTTQSQSHCCSLLIFADKAINSGKNYCNKKMQCVSCGTISNWKPRLNFSNWSVTNGNNDDNYRNRSKFNFADCCSFFASSCKHTKKCLWLYG